MAFFVERKCEECGRQVFLYDKDPKSSGLRIGKGDTVHTSLTELVKQFKLRGGAQFSQAGLDYFARSLLLPKSTVARHPQEVLPEVLEAWRAKGDAVIEGSPRLKHLDLEAEDDANAAIALITSQKEIPEFAALILVMACDMVKEALQSNDAWAAAGASVFAASAHAMLVFKTEFEETIWRGHSVEALRAAVNMWNSNRLNDSEEFWQQAFTARSFVLSQVFATPVVIVAGKAYVGGKSVANTGGGVSDFLLKNELTSRTAIVELKVPATLLLATHPYRGTTYAPSPELVGAVAQVSSYAASLAEDAMLRLRSKTPLEPARSECVVIVGTADTELVDDDRRRSFELYRSELRNVRVVTYDELFHRIASLLQLFGG